MTIEYRNTTNDEAATLKCSILQANKMQCSHQVAKVIKADVLPTQLEIINTSVPIQFGICQGHFNVLINKLTKVENLSVIDLDAVNTATL